MNQNRKARQDRFRIVFGTVVTAILLGTVALAQPAPPAQPTSATSELFRIGVGDLLSVIVFEGGDTSNHVEECLVRPDGRITIGLIGDLQADGLTPTELTARIKKDLEVFYKDPKVTVVVRQINSYRVFMIGEVRTPQVINSVAPLRVLQALAIAGGFTEFGKGPMLIIRERRGAPPVRIELDVRKIVSGEKPEMNILLEAGDVVVAK